MNNKLLRKGLTLLLLASLLIMNVTASTATEQKLSPYVPQELFLQAMDLESMQVMIELQAPPLAVFQQNIQGQLFESYRTNKHIQRLQTTRQKIIHDFLKLDGIVKINYEYQHLFNGFSLQIDSKDLETLSSFPEIKNIYGINEYYLHREYSVPTVSAPLLWEVRDAKGKLLTGQDILVGIIDTGIDYWHADMGGGIGKKPDGTYYKVRGGYDFADMSPIPHDGGMSFHGTHVAGIVAGNGEAGIATGESVGKGVAPEASLMAYKVFASNRRNTGGDAIIKALEAAVVDGCHVVNLSLGKFFGWTEDPLSLVCDRAVDAGVIVVASAGNDGMRNEQLNLFPLASPSSGLKTISVASSDETVKPGFIVRISEEEELGTFPGQMLVYSPPLKSDTAFQLLPITGYGAEKDYEQSDVEGKAVLVKRGGISFREKALIAAKHGASMLLIYNSVPGLFGGTLGEVDDYIPSMAISKEDGEMLLDIITRHPESHLIFSYDQISVMSSFSSQGPTPDYYLKPDMTAPGSSILSSAPGGSYAYASGTSMSAPHVAGGAALMRQLHPDWSPAEIKSLLVNYSDLILQPQTRETYSIYRQGAGRMNLSRSARGMVTANPVNLSFFHVKEGDHAELSFELSNKGSTQLNLTFETWTDSPAYQISLECSDMTINSGEIQTINARLVLDENSEVPEGHREFYLTVRYLDQTMTIPGIFYYGHKEPLEAVLTSFSYPTLAISPNNDGNGDFNYFYFMSPYLIDGIQVNLFDESASKNLGVLAYVRKRMGAGYFRVQFDGSVMGRQLSDGMYVFKSYILPKGKDYQKKSSWLEGKESRVLIDREAPVLTVALTRINPVKVLAEGKITDNHASLGVFLYYEIDDEEFEMLRVNSDGTFKAEIPIHDDQFFIRFTAQDLAGNIARTKKRIP